MPAGRPPTTSPGAPARRSWSRRSLFRSGPPTQRSRRFWRASRGARAWRSSITSPAPRGSSCRSPAWSPSWPRADRPRFLYAFDWTGTHDPTPYLCVPEAIRCVGSLLPGGWPAVMARNRTLALEARAILGRRLGIAAPAPDEMIGSLVSLPLPDGPSAASPLATDPLQDALLERFAIEVPVFPWPAPPARLIRLSCQLYNSSVDYERLAAALDELLGDWRA